MISVPEEFCGRGLSGCFIVKHLVFIGGIRLLFFNKFDRKVSPARTTLRIRYETLESIQQNPHQK
jgi:hypothetical protein